jgi:PKD repeat protein
VRLKDLPVASFEFEITYSPIDGIVVDFINNSTEADATDAWLWDFGDGGVSDDMSPSHTYTEFTFYRETPYTVCLTAKDRCDITDMVCLDLLLSPLDLLSDVNNEILIFPNPGKGIFNIKANESIHQLTIFDGNGKNIESSSPMLSTVEVDITSHASGVYYMLLDLDERKIMKRVVLDKK